MSRRIERDDTRYYPSVHGVGDIYGTTCILLLAIFRSPQIFPQPDRAASHSGNPKANSRRAASAASSSDDRRWSPATGPSSHWCSYGGSVEITRDRSELRLLILLEGMLSLSDLILPSESTRLCHGIESRNT
jgi:hypothetical protein